MSPVVELIAASKRYGQVEALRGVSLAIQSSEIVAMLGPNGALCGDVLAVFMRVVFGWLRRAGACHGVRDGQGGAVIQRFGGALNPDIVEATVERAMEVARLEPAANAERHQRLTSEAQRLGEEIARLADGIASGGPLSSLVEALKGRERQRADLLAQLEHLDGMAKAPVWGDDIRGKLRDRLTDWHGLLGRQPEMARQILRKLLDGRLVLKPNAAARVYELQGRASYGRLLDGLAPVVGYVPPG